MMRLLFCLPLCLVLAPSYRLPPVVATREAERVEDDTTGKNTTTQTAKRRLAAGKGQALVDPHGDPVVFLQNCLKHCEATVQGFSLMMRKQERIGTILHPLEIIEVHYREHPHSVLFRWHQGARLTDRALFVQGEHKDSAGKSQIMAHSPLLKIVKPSDPEGYFAKQSGRYPMSTFGLKQVMQRVLTHWAAAQAEGTLHVEYEGLWKVPEAGGVTCYKFHRTKYARPEGHDGSTEVILFIDRETLLQVGSIVYGKDRQLLGEYYFRDIRLNPTFAPDQFDLAAVEK